MILVLTEKNLLLIEEFSKSRRILDMTTFSDLNKKITRILVSKNGSYLYLFDESGEQYHIFSNLQEVVKRSAKKLKQDRIVNLDIGTETDSNLLNAFLNPKRNQICLQFSHGNLLFLKS